MPFAALLLAAALQATPLPSPAATPAATPAAPPAGGPLALSATSIVLEPGQSQTIAVSNATGAIAATASSAIVTATVDQSARTVTIAGVRPGNGTLTIADQSGQSQTITVRVAYAAATVPSALTLRVTGDPIDPAWLQKQVTQAVMQSIALQPGVGTASVELGAFSLPPTFAPGAEAAVPIPVAVPGGAQYLDVNATLNVTLDNVSAGPFLPPLLLYDDDPEKIAGDGVLFRGRVDPAQPARLYYYHQDTASPRRLLLVLTSASDQPSSVQVIDASAGPNIDVMSVGHAVTRDFLVRKPRNEGVVLDVSSAAPVTLDDFQNMQPLDGAAGSVGINVLNGGPVTVTVLAVAPDATPAEISAALGGPQLPDDGHHRTGVFDIADYAHDTVAYTIGSSDDASIDYGAQTPPAAATQNGHDYGEYGVLRSLTFEIANPGDSTAIVYLYERPLGGVVRSSFVIDGQLYEMGCARVANRYQIGQPLSVPPGSTNISVQTMTDGGSNYPLEVGVSATPPLPSTPPMNAPDGCFPKPQATPAASPQPSPTAKPRVRAGS